MGYTQRTTVKMLGDRPTTNYVVIPKGLLLDKELSSDARLVCMYLLSLDDGWNVNQRGITTALGWPAGTHRTTNAIQQLVKRGWVRHNDYTTGLRVFKHEYVLHRDRRFHDDQSSPSGTGADGSQSPATAVASSRSNDDQTSSPIKYLSKTDGVTASSRTTATQIPDPWGGGWDAASPPQVEASGIEVVGEGSALPLVDIPGAPEAGPPELSVANDIWDPFSPLPDVEHDAYMEAVMAAPEPLAAADNVEPPTPEHPLWVLESVTESMELIS